MKRFFAILLVICTLLALCGCSKSESAKSSDTIEGRGFKSAEKAILAYAEALQSGDVKEILSTFAIETYVDNMDMEAYLEQTGAYMLSDGLVSEDDYSREIRLIKRQSDIAWKLGYLYINHTEAGFPENGQLVSIRKEYETADKFIDAMIVEDWAEILEEMEIGDVLTAEDIIPDKLTEDYFKHLERQADIYGYDEIIPLAIEITLDGVDYYLCADAACYDGTWYIQNISGMIGTMLGANTMSCGLVER